VTITNRELYQRPATSWDTTQYSVGADQEGPWDPLVYEGATIASEGVAAAAPSVYDSVIDPSTSPQTSANSRWDECGPGMDDGDWDHRVYETKT
jgi:hypothetical protein